MDEKRKQQIREYNKKYSTRPEVKARIKIYNSRPEIKVYHKAYRERPENKAKQKEYMKGYCKQYNLKNKEHRRLLHKRYYSRPEIREHEKQMTTKYRSNPERKEHYRIIGREYHSRPEVKKHRKEYYQRSEVKERIKEYCSRPEVKEHNRENKREHRKNNIELYREYDKKRSKKPERILLNRKLSLKRRAKLHEVIHDFSYEEWESKKEATKGICPSCNKFVGVNKITLDHIMPVSKAPNGLIYTIKDITPLCRMCNSSKNNKIIYTQDYTVQQSLVCE